ncbi:dCMP deaminase [Nematocida minor]|uniref:dCMP deaminase n=1 Tax=Nematocida minor TaxID=1912983 RepID=UPI002221244B|nr:dCMP deaminase [Nematocida minor]KAI5189378.1 dCMP deaminase [Nematocida minor]
MLFCVTSISDKAAEKVLKCLVGKGSEQKIYKKGMLLDIMDNEGWKKDLAIHLEDPLSWDEFHIRPFTVLIIVHPVLEENETIDAKRFNSYSKKIMAIRHLFLNKTNLLEIQEHETEKIFKIKSRPTWQEYFMSIAQIASTRSNCMKRKVGAVIVKNSRVLCIGYNGTSVGSVNCADGGCVRCNNNTHRGKELSDCFCIHAEESAFLERNASEINGSELYTTVYPCRLCSRKIVQLKISKVYYLHEYTEDEEVKKLFIMNNVEVCKLDE